MLRPSFLSWCSKLAKKCILSRTIGPPIVPPHWVLRVSRLVQVLLLDEEILVRHRGVGEVADRAAVPAVGALLGDRVDDAGGGGAVLGVELVRDDLELLNRFERGARLRARAPAAQVVVVAPPSIRYTTPLPCWPLMVTLSDEESAAWLYTTPGSRETRPVKLREPDGRFSISPADTLPPTCADVRSTCGASPSPSGSPSARRP